MDIRNLTVRVKNISASDQGSNYLVNDKRESDTPTPMILHRYSHGTPTFFWSIGSIAFPPLSFILIMKRFKLFSVF